ncbi:MAG: glycosyltransferase family 4 protein [Chlamydiota bacterium]
MISIAVDARMINSSGIGTYLKALLPSLCSCCEVILLGDYQQLKAYKAKIVDFRAPIYSIKEQLWFPIKIPSCNIFWSPHYNIPLFPIKANKRLVTLHDVFHLVFLNQLSLPQKLYAKLVINKAVQISDAVVTVSEFSKKEIQKHCRLIKPAKVHVIHNGVDCNHFQNYLDDEIQKNLRYKYKLPQKYMLCVGNLKPHKNLGNLLIAFENLLRSKDIDNHLVIVGDREKLRSADNEIIQYVISSDILKNRVSFTGYVDDIDLPGIYTMAELFAFPSKYEGFGLPPLEAMAAGCPVIASSAASIPEVCGDAAEYFDPDDPDKIATVIKKVTLSQDLQNALIKKGYARHKEFDWQSTQKAHYHLLKSMLPVVK